MVRACHVGWNFGILWRQITAAPALHCSSAGMSRALLGMHRLRLETRLLVSSMLNIQLLTTPALHGELALGGGGGWPDMNGIRRLMNSRQAGHQASRRSHGSGGCEPGCRSHGAPLLVPGGWGGWTCWDQASSRAGASFRPWRSTTSMTARACSGPLRLPLLLLPGVHGPNVMEC